jgi:hypothetical protein
MQSKKGEKNSRGKAEIFSEVCKYHRADGTVALWGPVRILDLKKKTETK